MRVRWGVDLFLAQKVPYVIMWVVGTLRRWHGTWISKDAPHRTWTYEPSWPNSNGHATQFALTSSTPKLNSMTARGLSINLWPSVTIWQRSSQRKAYPCTLPPQKFAFLQDKPWGRAISKNSTSKNAAPHNPHFKQTGNAIVVDLVDPNGRVAQYAIHNHCSLRWRPRIGKRMTSLEHNLHPPPPSI